MFEEKYKQINRIYYPKEYEIPILLASLYYPNLENKNIRFKFGKIKTTLACKPQLSSLFNKKRVYEITINDNKLAKCPLLKEVPLMAQIGAVAHEFAHIIDYENKSFWKIILCGLQYLNKFTRAKFEKKIDKMTIKFGYKWQLYAWSEFIQKSEKVPEVYKKYKRRYYLQPMEIKDELN